MVDMICILYCSCLKNPKFTWYSSKVLHCSPKVQFYTVKSRMGMRNGKAKWKSEEKTLLFIIRSWGCPHDHIHAWSIGHSCHYSYGVFYYNLVWSIDQSWYFLLLGIRAVHLILSWLTSVERMLFVLHVFFKVKNGNILLSHGFQLPCAAVDFPDYFLGVNSWTKISSPILLWRNCGGFKNNIQILVTNKLFYKWVAFFLETIKWMFLILAAKIYRLYCVVVVT